MPSGTAFTRLRQPRVHPATVSLSWESGTLSARGYCCNHATGGVKASANTLFANETDMCNFGKGGGKVLPAS